MDVTHEIFTRCYLGHGLCMSAMFATTPMNDLNLKLIVSAAIHKPLVGVIVKVYPIDIVNIQQLCYFHKQFGWLVVGWLLVGGWLVVG